MRGPFERETKCGNNAGWETRFTAEPASSKNRKSQTIHRKNNKPPKVHIGKRKTIFLDQAAEKKDLRNPDV